jgi:hypothetical protein
VKVYRIPAGTYFEKQEDARKADRKFETVEFPFAASPKADFVTWLNNRQLLDVAAERQQERIGDFLSAPIRAAEAASGMTGDQAMERNSLLDDVTWKPTAQPQPTQPVQTDAAKFAEQVNERWNELPLGLRVDLGLIAFEDARSTWGYRQ